MAVKRLAKMTSGNIPKGIAIGLAASLTSTLIGTAIAAGLLASEKIGEGSLGYIALTLLLLSSILGALVSVMIIRQKRLPICLISGGAYLLSLLAINALFYQGTYSGTGESAMVILAGALSVAIIGVTGGKKTIKKRKR